MPAPITVADDVQQRAIGSLRRYFDEHLDTELGDLGARLLLEFVVKEIGPSIYNAALADAQAFLRERVDDLDGALSQAEFGYWPVKRK